MLLPTVFVRYFYVTVLLVNKDICIYVCIMDQIAGLEMQNLENDGLSDKARKWKTKSFACISAFASPTVWSVIFQVLHFPGATFSVAPFSSAL